MASTSASMIGGESNKHEANHQTGFRDRTSSKSKRDSFGSFASKRFGSSKRKLNDYEFRKMRLKRDRIALPTNFLLGGNINDPLNLSSISNDKSGQSPLVSQASTPSPGTSMSRPLDIKIPKNFQDPLNLNSSAECSQISPLSISKRARRRKRRHSVRVSVADERPAQQTAVGTAFAARMVEASLSDSELGAMGIPSEAPPGKRTRTSSNCQVDSISPDFRITAPLFLSPDAPSPTGSNRPLASKTSKTPAKRQDHIVSPVGVKAKFPGSVIVVNSDIGCLADKSGGCSGTPSTKQTLTTSSASFVQNKQAAFNKRGFANQGKRKRRFKQNRSDSFGTGGQVPSSVTAGPSVSRIEGKAVPSNRGRPEHSEEKKIARFRYGNYNRYYGKRFDAHSGDPRMKTLRSVWFEGKQVLDVGCNTGTLTSLIARNYGPSKMLGIDIDGHLVSLARNSISQFMDDSQAEVKGKNNEPSFPPALSKMYGPLGAPNVKPSTNFPGNLYFKQANYVLQSDDLIALSSPKFHVILMLSITKWIHLNWGDTGIERCFRRAFAELLPGGCLILEPQPFNTYEKRCFMPEMNDHFKSIQLKPERFVDYLLSTVGFSLHELAGVPFHKARGFRRPIHVFWKDPVPPVELRCLGVGQGASVSKRNVSMSSDADDYGYIQEGVGNVDANLGCSGAAVTGESEMAVELNEEAERLCGLKTDEQIAHGQLGPTGCDGNIVDNASCFTDAGKLSAAHLEIRAESECGKRENVLSKSGDAHHGDAAVVEQLLLNDPHEADVERCGRSVGSE